MHKVRNLLQGIINNGVDFTNALVDILDASKFDFHFTQYATYTDQAELYVVDYRGQYADGGTLGNPCYNRKCFRWHPSY